MNKLVLLLGLITLTACTNDSVLDAGTFPHEETFSHTVGTQTYNYKVDIVTYLGGTSPLVSTLKLSLD